MPKFITRTTTEGTGGNCMADVIELRSGPVIVIADECIATYRDTQHWREDGGDTMLAQHADSFERCATLDDDMRSNGPRGAVVSYVDLTFVYDISTYEPDGPVSVDLLHLPDGRVIGVNDECIVIYPSMEAFDAISTTGECEDWPSLPLN